MTSLILLNLPPSSFCAIDLASFTTSPRFRGIKNISPGIHFCYFSSAIAPTNPNTSRITELDNDNQTSSLHFRTGFFFATSPSIPYIIKKWDAKSESLLDTSQISQIDIDNVTKNLKEIHHEYLSPYEKLQVPEEKLLVWNNLISAINSSKDHLSRILGSSWTCESSRETSWESQELDDAIRARTDITGQRELSPNKSPEENDVLHFTRIDLQRTWPPKALGRERTIWARDRSWVLTNIFRRLSPDYNREERESIANSNSTAKSLASTLPSSSLTQIGQGALLSELVISFVLTVLLSNYSSTIQFKHILEISLTSGEAIKTHPAYFSQLILWIENMLKTCRLIVGEKTCESDDEDDDAFGTGVPVEDAILEEFVSGGDGFLINLLRGFNRNLMDVIADADFDEKNSEIRNLEKKFNGLKKFCRRFGWYLDDEYVRKGMLELPAEEGGGRVEMEMDDLEGEDERGEFAPVIVEL